MAADEHVVAGQHPLVVHQAEMRERRRAGAWIADALAAGEKVSGQLEIIDAEQCYADTCGEHQALFELHVEFVERARREVYPGVAITGDGPALHAMTPDPEQLLAHERDLNELTGDPGVRVLCRYDLRGEQPRLITQLATVHYQSVDDMFWSSEQRIGKLVVRGEDVTFLAVAGTAVLARFAGFLHEHGEELVLVNVPPIVMRVLSVLDFAERVGAEVIPMLGNDDYRGRRDGDWGITRGR